MDKYVCVPKDEKSAWYIHMCNFMVNNFGMKKIIYGFKYEKNKIKKIISFFSFNKNVIRQIEEIKEGSQLYFFHPMPLFWGIKKLSKELRKKKIITIGFICDIARLHLNDQENKNIIKRGLSRLKDRVLKYYDFLMVPTSKMKNYLIGIGIDSAKIIVHGLYDYYVKDYTKKMYTDNIIIIGDLSRERNGYLYQLHQLHNLDFKLYGSRFDTKYVSSNVKYMGMVDEAELNNKIDGKFGLCWYGSKVESSFGFSAEYMKMNSPHKVSCCIANDIPVIIHDEAGIADYIKKNHLGVLVHSLLELPDILSRITDAEYEIILTHVKEEGRRLRNGFHLEQSLKKIDAVCKSLYVEGK